MSSEAKVSYDLKDFQALKEITPQKKWKD